jgi:hypothetical protein
MLIACQQVAAIPTKRVPSPETRNGEPARSDSRPPGPSICCSAPSTRRGSRLPDRDGELMEFDPDVSGGVRPVLLRFQKALLGGFALDEQR